MGGTGLHLPSLQTCSDLSEPRLFYCQPLLTTAPRWPTDPSYTPTSSKTEKQSQGWWLEEGGTFHSVGQRIPEDSCRRWAHRQNPGSRWRRTCEGRTVGETAAFLLKAFIIDHPSSHYQGRFRSLSDCE